MNFYPLKVSHFDFQFWLFTPFFCLNWPEHYLTSSISFSKTRQNWPFLAFLINFCPLLSTRNVNIAFNIECDFFCDFQTLWCNTSFLVFCFLLRVVTKIITLDLHFLVFFETQSCQQRRQMSADIDTSYIWALQKLL